MGRKKPEKKVADVHTISRETWVKIGSHLADSVHDMEIDSEQLADEQGPEFMPALRGLAEWALKGGLAVDSTPKGK